MSKKNKNNSKNPFVMSDRDRQRLFNRNAKRLFLSKKRKTTKPKHILMA